MTVHKWTCRVYYEDTDAGGVVYYANYLKFAERARTELLRAQGVDQSQLAQDEQILFVVRRVQMELLTPAKLDDTLRIETSVAELRGASMVMHQQLFREQELVADISVTVACVDTDFKPRKLSQAVRSTMEVYNG